MPCAFVTDLKKSSFQVTQDAPTTHRRNPAFPQLVPAVNHGIGKDYFMGWASQLLVAGRRGTNILGCQPVMYLYFWSTREGGFSPHFIVVCGYVIHLFNIRIVNQG